MNSKNNKIYQLLNKFYTNFDLVVCLLVALIILLPKIPIISVPGVYISIRSEDFVVGIVYGLWVIGLLLKMVKIKKNTLVFPLSLFLIFGLFTTVVGIVRQTVASPLLGVLYFSRYVEYIGMFVIMFSVYRPEKFSLYLKIIWGIMVGVLVYGLLAKYNLVPMYRTMVSSGTKIYYYQIKFLQSTFGGHYDFGAYLMFNIPILLALFLNHKKYLQKLFFLILIGLSCYLFYFSYARSAYLGLISSLVIWFILRKSKLFFLPILELVRVFYSYFSGKFSKYQYSFSLKFNQSDDPTTVVDTIKEVTKAAVKKVPHKVLKNATDSAKKITTKSATVKDNANANVATPNSNIDVSLDPSAEYRLGRWKELLGKFKEHPLIGNGFSSVGVGADGDYVRWLTEVGIIGSLVIYYMLFQIFKFLYTLFRTVEEPLAKDFFLALTVGFIGMLVNAVFIDVFEASKIAFYFWFMMGIASGYQYYLVKK